MTAGGHATLRSMREARGFSLRRFAEMTGIDHSTIAKIERGEVRLASHHIERFSAALGCRPEDLVAAEPLSDLDREILDALRGIDDDGKRSLIALFRALRADGQTAMSVAAVVQAIGVEAIMARLGVSLSSVKEARRAGAFPSSWHPLIEALGAEKGVRVPRCLFSWKPPADGAPQ